jgi:hypothetical protein
MQCIMCALVFKFLVTVIKNQCCNIVINCYFSKKYERRFSVECLSSVFIERKALEK